VFQNILKFGFTIFLTIGIYFFLFSIVPVEMVMSSLKGAELKYLILAIVIALMRNTFLSAYRWQVILRYLKHSLSFKEILLIKMGSMPLIDFLPIRMGEITRLLYLKRRRQIPYIQTALSILVEFVFSIAVLVLFMIAGCGVYVYYQYTGKLYVNTELPLAGFMMLHLWNQNPFESPDLNEDRLKKWTLTKKYFYKLKEMVSHKGIVLMSIILIFLQVFNFYLVSRALSLNLPLYAILIFTPIVILGGSTKITTAGLGIRELSTLFLFMPFAAKEALILLGILYFFIETLIPVTIGAFCTGTFLNKIALPHNQKGA